MKKFVAFFIVICLQIPLFSQWGSIAYFQLNRDYIAKNLCVNKDKPKLNCNGQCYLAKQLKATEEKEKKSNSERIEKMQEIVLFLEANPSIKILEFSTDVLITHSFYHNSYHFHFTHSIDQPPAIF